MKQKTGLTIILLLLIGIIPAAGIWTHMVTKAPEALFEESVKVSDDQLGAPSLELRAEDEEIAIKDGIVNILLLGIDETPTGGTTSGTMPHTDAVMVIAVNFNEESVNLLSIPRDALTVALPPERGFYKLNGTFNVGGGTDDYHAGCDYVRREAEQWMGGVSIPYYYGLDFQAVVDIIDAIGGIDYDVDQSYSAGGHYIGKGQRHLDGEAVLGYLRIRRSADGTDKSRTDRQRRMMIAIFEKLKSEAKFSTIPALIHSASSGIYTNTTISQTAALANYATELNPENIHTREFYGEYTINYTWAYNFIDQEKRIKVIKDVYGFEPEKMGTDTRRYEKFLMEDGAKNLKVLAQGEKVLNDADEACEGYADCKAAYEALKKIHEAMDRWNIESCSNSFGYSDEERKEYSNIKAGLSEARKNLIEQTEKLAKESGYAGKLNWTPGYYWEDTDINTVYVDFG